MGGDAWAWNALVTHKIRKVMYYLHKLAWFIRVYARVLKVILNSPKCF